MNNIGLLAFLLCFFTCAGCSARQAAADAPAPQQAVYDETGCLYTSYNGLVMAGYQGWFAAEGDASERGWYHYQNRACGGFFPGCAAVDLWPDVSGYTKTYETPFRYANGASACLYSPYDEESVDLHFKWMKEYGIDGVFMQRFVGEIKHPSGKRHFNKVLENALKAARKYQRAICVMYDLSGCRSEDMALLEQDWQELQAQFSLFDNRANPTYVRHKGRPLLSIWGVGFNDNRRYTVADVDQLVSRLKGPDNKVSVMLGVPYYWRTFGNDTEHSALLHALIKRSDIIMPWAVGRYNNSTYGQVAGAQLPGDVAWCRNNRVDYVPLVFPGFSWGNLKRDTTIYNAIPRLRGDFLWRQVAGARQAGASSLYVAMFDEIDEGTAIFKCLPQNGLPLNGDWQFVGLESGLEPDYYLWLTGQAARWFHGSGGYSAAKPQR